MKISAVCVVGLFFYGFASPAAAVANDNGGDDENVSCHHHHKLCSINVKASDKFDPSAFVGGKKWYANAYNLVHKHHHRHHNASYEDEYNHASDFQTLLDHELSSNKSHFCAYMKLEAKNKTLNFDASISSQKFNRTVHKVLHQTCPGSRGVYDYHKRRHGHGGKTEKGVLVRLTFVDTDNKNYIILNSCGAVYQRRRRAGEAQQNADEIDALGESAENEIDVNYRHRHHVRRYQSIAIISKSKTLPKKVLDELQQKIVKLGFSAGGFRPVNNTSCP